MSKRTITINPALAEQLINEKLTEYRRFEGRLNINKTHALRMAEDMKEGRWFSRIQGPIMFNADGDVMDGCHRLHAILWSGTTHEFEVIELTPDEVELLRAPFRRLPKEAEKTD